MQKRTRYFLGVDGGATKTVAVVVNNASQVRGTGKSGPSNYHEAGSKVAAHNIVAAVQHALRTARVQSPQIQGSAFGLAGINAERDQRIMRTALRRGLPRQTQHTCIVVNDIIAGFRTGTDERFGAAIIAGTGSNAFARSRSGAEVFAGGLERILSDDGSGYAIGRYVLRAATQSFDERSPKTILERMVNRRLDTASIRKASTIVTRMTKEEIANLAPLAERAARRGDRAAKRIINDAADELALMATTVIRRARLRSTAFPLVLIGGVFHNTLLRTKFERVVKRYSPRVRFIRPTKPFAVGAALLARDQVLARNRKSG